MNWGMAPLEDLMSTRPRVLDNEVCSYWQDEKAAVHNAHTMPI